MLQGCPQNDIEQVLQDLPESLDETYERMLRTIAPASRGRVIRLLQCLSVAIRPMRVEELAEILVLDFDGPKGTLPELKDRRRLEDRQRDVLSICSSLVILVDNDNSDVIQFSHFTVKEFLTSDRLFTSKDISRFHIMREQAHTTLAQACLGTLLHFDESSKLKGYASRHWVEHAQFGMVSSRIADGMRRLFDSAQPYFAAWLQLYDLDERWPHFGDSRITHRGSPLYYASLCGFRDLAAHIIAEHPEQVNGRSGLNHSPLAAALYKRYFDIAKLLHQHGAAVDLYGRNNRTLLFVASVLEGYVDVVRWLLDHGSDAELGSDDHWTPIIGAAAKGHLETIQMLLSHGVRVNATSEEGYTPLHVASYFCHSTIAGLTLQPGANAGARDTEYCTPSHLASSRGKSEVVHLLLDNVADIDAKDKRGRTPLDLAINARRAEVVRQLLDRGANVNSQDNDGSTLLHPSYIENVKTNKPSVHHSGIEMFLLTK